jgi:predicted nucleic-acid-binding Zn-ribbon protein
VARPLPRKFDKPETWKCPKCGGPTNKVVFMPIVPTVCRIPGAIEGEYLDVTCGICGFGEIMLPKDYKEPTVQ